MAITLTMPLSASGYELPPPARPITWHGFFVDANQHDAASLTALFDQTVVYGLTSIMFANGDTDKLDELLTVCDSYRVRASCGPRTEIDEILWNVETAPTLNELVTELEPMLTTLAAHDSLVHWYPLDEPFLNNTDGIEPADYMDRAALLCEAYRTIDTGHPIVPLFIGLDRLAAGIIACQPDKLLIDVYPFGMQLNGETIEPSPEAQSWDDMILTPFGLSMTAQEYIQAAKALAPELEFLIVCQAHNFFGPPADESLWEEWGNRKPTVAEMQLQHDLAAEEGATEIYWFRWEDDLAPEVGEIHGLENDQPLLDAVIAISQGGAVVTDIVGTADLVQPLWQIHATGTVEVDELESDGVPQPSIPFNTGANAVMTWWDGHILNPIAQGGYATIISPPTRYTLTSGQSIVTAYNNLVANYPEGGTIILGEGTYDDWPDIFGYQFSDLGHVHIRAAEGASVTVELPRDRMIIAAHPWTTRYHTLTESNYPGWNFSVGISDGVANNLTEFGVNARVLVTTDRIQDVYIKGITFDSMGGDRRFDMMAARRIMWDECTFINGVGAVSPAHVGPVNGRVCLDHIYYRHCVINGTWTDGSYLDGVFGFAAIECEWPADLNNAPILALCNDDFTRDYNNNGIYAVEEKRMAQFVVIHGGEFGDALYVCQATGRDVLVTDVVADTPIDVVLWWETKASYRQTLDVFCNGILRNVEIPNGAVRCLIHTKNTDYQGGGRQEPDMFGHQIINVEANYGDDIEHEGNYG